MQCYRCNALLPDGATVCTNCGSQISYNQINYQQPQPQQIQPQQIQPQQMNTGQLYQNQQMNTGQIYQPQQMNTGQLYQNQQMQYGQSGYNPVQPYEKSPIGFIIFCIIMVALTVTEFLLFIKPGFLTEKRHDKLIEEANLTTEATTEITTTEVATTEITSTEETTEATTTEAPTTEATTTEAPTTEATTTEANLNTTELPVNTDFSLYTSNWHYNGLPSDARKITDYSQINGDWKMMYWWDPDHVFDSYAEELGNASLVFDGSVLSLTYKYGYIQWENSESYDESYIEPTTYTGSENADGFEIYNSYGFSIYGLEFYTINGSQYGFGSTISQSGEVATVLLVRP